MDDKIKETLVKAYGGYALNTALRATVQLIPYLGSSLDTLLAGRGSKIQLERLEHLFSELTIRLGKIESLPPINEQELYDLSIDVMEKSVKARLAEKRALYANVLVRHLIETPPIDESELALRIIADLDLIHIEILREAVLAPECGEPFKGLKVVSFKKPGLDGAEIEGPVVIRDRLFHWPAEVLRYAVSDLVAKGLLYDEGDSRWSTKAMQYLVVTDTGEWLYKWISEKIS